MSSCTKKDKKQYSKGADIQLPDSLNFKELNVISKDIQMYDTLHLVRKQVFESNEDVYIEGYTSDVVIDHKNRVYIAAGIPRTTGIYVFEPNGVFITRFGHYGKGPGEFLVIPSLEIKNGYLFTFDRFQRRISIFSLDSLALYSNAILSRSKVKEDESIKSLTANNHFFLINDSTLLMEFDSNIRSNQNRTVFYYKVSKTGAILPNKVLTLRNPLLYMPKTQFNSKGFYRISQTMPFSPTSLITVSENYIYTNWTEDFLIKVYDKNGEYLHTFYYPYPNIKLDISELNLSKSEQKLIEENEKKIPENWPVIHTMFVDDKNRLWILTITDSKTHYMGWILNSKDELITTFQWPGKRAKREPITAPLFIVKNGYLYTRERNLEKGIDRIVKYKIILRER